MNWIPWAALVSAIAAIIVSIAGIWASRQRSATEVQIVKGLRSEMDQLIKDNSSLRARVRALENMNNTFLTTLEEYHRGTKINVKQIRQAGLTPLWEPVGTPWRGDDSAKDK